MTPPDRRMLPVPGAAVAPDRRYRRPELRPERRRLGRRLTQVGAWLVAGALCVGAIGWSVERLLHAEALTVRAIEIRGHRRLSSEEIERLLDGLRGEHIFKADFETYRRRLLDSPWIANATFRRALPTTIAIDVVERTPLVIARLGEQLYLVDDAGVVIDEYGTAYADLDLPIVDGLLTSPAAPGPLIDAQRIHLVSALLTALDARTELRRRVSQVNVTNPHDALVLFDSPSIWLHLGEARFVERLASFFEIAPTLQERFGDIDSVDLRFEPKVFVRPRGGHRAGRPASKHTGETIARPSAGRAGEDAHGA